MSSAAIEIDVLVVGAGVGGVYAVHKFREQNLSVVGLERAGGFGGVWYHNRYPGSRVDLDSLDYTYFFSQECYRDWRWTERYASQEELLAFINHVAERLKLHDHFQFNTALTEALWDPAISRWRVKTDRQKEFSTRFLVMATGNLSVAKAPHFAGLETFRGQYVQTSHWPADGVEFDGKKVAIIGTGSSGVQAVPVVAKKAERLYVFQRSPNFVVPAQNRPIDEAKFMQFREGVTKRREQLLATPSGVAIVNGGPAGPASAFSPEQQNALLEAQWQRGGQNMNRVFSDQSTNTAANAVVADFVRAKIRSIVKDQGVAEALCPYDHPIGSRRLCLGIDYYESYNRSNVHLVNIKREPIEQIVESGIRTSEQHYEVDLIIFAIGFHAFRGAIEAVDIRNEKGASPTDHWNRGPRTALGLMTDGFPNFFMLTGPGSPSVLANLILGNEFHVDWIADAISYMGDHGYTTIEPTKAAVDEWTCHVSEAASSLLRLQVNNYMVHVNPDDMSRVFIPYVGGLDKYVARAKALAADNYRGFSFTSSGSARTPMRTSLPGLEEN